MSIPFTQFLRPNGRRAQVSIQRPAPIEEMALQLTSAGCRFEIEELQTGLVSIEAVAANHDSPDDPHCLALELVVNGPAVPEAVDALIQSAIAQARQLGIVGAP